MVRTNLPSGGAPARVVVFQRILRAPLSLVKESVCALPVPAHSPSFRQVVACSAPELAERETAACSRQPAARTMKAETNAARRAARGAEGKSGICTAGFRLEAPGIRRART